MENAVVHFIIIRHTLVALIRKKPARKLCQHSNCYNLQQLDESFSIHAAEEGGVGLKLVC
uniref:Uncharacterized protein n=1 Tax=Anguilla anguilla TaxID=7936 RepID=A0A0E9W4T5_ANGAN